MSDKHERELDTAQAHLQKLMDERSTLSAQLAQASDAEVINVDALVKLQRRADEIPMHVYAATVRAARARIIVLEERLISEQEVEQHEIVAANEFYVHLQAAQAAYDEAVRDRDNARTQVMMTRGDLSSARRELERVVSENTRPHAPVVRSLPHAIRAA
jgi:tRNA A37 N6-isopentenylltransferase MiaA